MRTAPTAISPEDRLLIDLAGQKVLIFLYRCQQRCCGLADHFFVRLSDVVPNVSISIDEIRRRILAFDIETPEYITVDGQINKMTPVPLDLALQLWRMEAKEQGNQWTRMITKDNDFVINAIESAWDGDQFLPKMYDLSPVEHLGAVAY
jgi:hypothetical protein